MQMLFLDSQVLLKIFCLIKIIKLHNAAIYELDISISSFT